MEPLQRTEIKSGIYLNLLPDSKFKTYQVSVFFHQPLREETATDNALIPMVLKRGSKKYPSAQQIAICLEEQYGASFSADVTKLGDSQVLSFQLNGVASGCLPPGEDTFRTGLDILFDCMLHPNCDKAFPKDVLQQESDNLQKIIEGLINDKRSYAVERLVEEMFRGNPYGVCEYGTVKRLPQLDGAALYKRYESVLADSVIDIFVNGNFDAALASKLISEYIAPLPERKHFYPAMEKAAPADTVTFLDEELEVAQGKLVMGFTVPTEHKEALMLYTSILGSGTHSKLFMNVREKLSLAYYAVARSDRHKGIMLVDSGIEVQKYQQTVEEIFAQVEEIKRGNITDMELTLSVESLCNALRSAGDSMSTLAQFYLAQVGHEDVESPAERMEKLQKVTKEEIVQLAQGVRPSMVYFLKNHGGDKNAV